MSKLEYQRRWRNQNRDRVREYSREWYYANKDRVAKQRHGQWLKKHPIPRVRRTPETVRRQLCEAARRHQAKRNLFYWSLKKLFRCMDCGEDRPACLDFHHRDPSTKRMGIGQKARTVSREKLLKEILKCDVICANCHRQRHYEERTGLLCEKIEIAEEERLRIEEEARHIYEQFVAAGNKA